MVVVCCPRGTDRVSFSMIDTTDRTADAPKDTPSTSTTSQPRPRVCSPVLAADELTAGSDAA